MLVSIVPPIVNTFSLHNIRNFAAFTIPALQQVKGVGFDVEGLNTEVGLKTERPLNLTTVYQTLSNL